MKNNSGEKNPGKMNSGGDIEEDNGDAFDDFAADAMIDEWLEDKNAYKFRKLLNKIHKMYKTKMEYQEISQSINLKLNLKNAYVTIYQIASAAAILFAVCYFIVIKQYDKPLAQKIASEYNKSNGGYFVRVENASLDLKEAIKLYGKKDYAKAIQHLAMVTDNSNQVVFFKGILYFEKEDYLTALTYFIQLEGKEENDYNIKAKWYVSLCCLGLNKPENAIPYLNWLKEYDSYYSSKAQEILNRLSIRK